MLKAENGDGPVTQERLQAFTSSFYRELENIKDPVLYKTNLDQLSNLAKSKKTPRYVNKAL